MPFLARSPSVLQMGRQRRGMGNDWIRVWHKFAPLREQICSVSPLFLMGLFYKNFMDPIKYSFPKIFINKTIQSFLENEMGDNFQIYWIRRNPFDWGYSGRLREYLAAKDSGINLPPIKCFPLKCCAANFGAVKDIKASGDKGDSTSVLPFSTSHPGKASIKF